MSRSYTIGLLLGLCKRAAEGDEMLGGASVSETRKAGLPRQPKHPEKYIKAPRSISGRKRRRFVRQRKMPKKLLSA
jgi:hypothetical protein